MSLLFVVIIARRADHYRGNRIMDMEMMICYNAVERDVDGWKGLLAKADERLKLQRVVTPPGSAQSVMEFVLER